MKPKKLKLRITAPVPIHGRQPGEVFEVRCDSRGVPLDENWRKRLRDEQVHQCGAVEIVKPEKPAKAKETS
ncbi:MAG: hypothetical protein ACLFU3_08555 [Dichotomicrobium sp.]